MPRILNFIPISCMEPRNLPEDTHVIFQPTLVHWNMCLYFKFELCTQRWHVPSQNHEPSWEKLRFARSLYQNLFLFGQFFYHGMVLPWHDTMPSFMILKPSFSMFSTEPRCPDVWILFSFFAWDLLPPSIYIGPNFWTSRIKACAQNEEHILKVVFDQPNRRQTKFWVPCKSCRRPLLNA